MQHKSLAMMLAALAGGIGHIDRRPAPLPVRGWAPPPPRSFGKQSPAGSKLARQVAKRRLGLATIR